MQTHTYKYDINSHRLQPQRPNCLSTEAQRPALKTPIYKYNANPRCSQLEHSHFSSSGAERPVLKTRVYKENVNSHLLKQQRTQFSSSGVEISILKIHGRAYTTSIHLAPDYSAPTLPVQLSAASPATWWKIQALPFEVYTTPRDRKLISIKARKWKPIQRAA